MQHQIKKELDSALHFWAPTKISVATSFDVNPTKDRPPQARIHRGDPSNGALAVISDQIPLFFNETCRKNPTGLHTRALEVEANLQKLLHDREASLHQQINHHRDVVSDKDFAVVQFRIGVTTFKSCNASGELSLNRYEGAFEVLLGLLDHLVFFGTGTKSLTLFCKSRPHGTPGAGFFLKPSDGKGFRQWKQVWRCFH